MFNPEVTLRIIRWSTRERPSYRMGRWTYGPKAIERRMARCCADNPECKKTDECYNLYVILVNATDNPKQPSGDPYERHGTSPMETYKLHGIKIVTDIVRC